MKGEFNCSVIYLQADLSLKFLTVGLCSFDVCAFSVHCS